MLIVSDLHLREETQDVVLGQVLPEVMRVAEDSGVSTIAILGDILHIRYHVPVKLLNGLRDLLRDSRQNWILLPGNHDQVDVEGRNALEPLDDLPNVTVYSGPTWDEHGLWFPYRKLDRLMTQLPAVAATPHAGCPEVLFIHQGIRDSWMNDNFRNTDGVPATMLEQFQMVICGHYHKHQFVNPRCAYVGSPYQTRADESDQPKGYCGWDGQTLTHVPMEWGPRYHRLTPRDGTLDLQGIRPGDEVRVTAGSKREAEALGRELNELGVSHVINVDAEKTEARLPVQDGAALDAYVRAYVQASETALDKTRLLKVLGDFL